MIIYDPKITGSFQVNGSTVTSIGEVDTISGSVAALNAATSSYALSSSISGSFTSISQSFASERLKNTTDTLTGDLTVTGTLTAQDLHVQEVTSSIVFSSGSNIFGENVSDTQIFTGSLQVSGSTNYLLGDVGIGTTSPAAKLHILGSTTGTAKFEGGNGDGGIDLKSTTQGTWELRARNFDDRLDIYSSTLFNTVATFHSSRNVGIGTTSPNSLLHLSGSDQNILEVDSSNSDGPYTVYKTAGTVKGYIGNAQGIMNSGTGNFGMRAQGDLTFSSGGGTEQMRIDSSGRLLVGKQSTSYSTEGIEIRSNEILATNDGGTVLSLNRLTDDGVILSIAQDTSTVANIGSNGADLYFSMDQGGGIGIGTTSPAGKLHVNQPNHNEDTAGYADDTILWRLRNETVSSTSTGRLSLYSGGSATVNIEGSTSRSTYFNAGDVGIGTTSPATKFEIRDNASAVNENYVNFERKTGSQSSYDATGFSINAIPTNNTGKTGISYLGLQGRYSALNGSHGTAAFITLTPGIGTAYGNGNIDFFIRNNTAPYTFKNDPAVSNTYWMDPVMTIRSNGGITFNGDTAAANALDDYEEGTWTPILKGTTSGQKTATGINIGRYTKIGNLVTVTGTCAWSGGDTLSGLIIIGNLPFTIGSPTTGSQQYRPGACAGGTSGITMPSGYTNGLAFGADAGTTYIYIMARSTSSYTHNPTIAASGAVYGFTMTYETTA